MGTKNEKIAKKEGLLSLFGRDSSKREKKRRYEIEMDEVKGKSGKAPRIGATHWVIKNIGGDR